MSFVSRNHPQQVGKRGALDEVDDRRTPPDLLEECRFLVGVPRFTLDVAATADNAVCADWLADGLAERWHGHVWCNPPYSACAAWVHRACDQMGSYRTATLLLPANRTEQAWWQDHIEHGRLWGNIDVYFLRGRRRFDRPCWQKPAKGDRPPFGLVVVHLRSGWAA